MMHLRRMKESSKNTTKNRIAYAAVIIYFDVPEIQYLVVLLHIFKEALILGFMEQPKSSGLKSLGGSMKSYMSSQSSS